MALISTKAHVGADYMNGLALTIAAPRLGRADWRARGLLRGAGAMTLLTSAITDYELGVRRRVPMRVHLALDAGTGAILLLAVPGLPRRARGPAGWLPHALVGAGEIVMACLTAREPGDKAAPLPAGPMSAQADSFDASTAPSPPAVTEPPAAPHTAEPPAAPHKTVLPSDPAQARARAMAMDDPLVAREESAAAAQAAAIGGSVSPEASDPAMAPVYEAGGGEQDGWEAVEDQLVENASHGEGGAAPGRDAFTPEVEADRSTAVYGEADSLPSTEVVSDSVTGGDDDRAGQERS